MSYEYKRRGKNWHTAMGLLFIVSGMIVLVRQILIWTPDFVFDFDPEIPKYGVETFDNLKKRVLDMVEYVRDKHPGESVVLVTHMDPIKAAVSYAMNLNAESIHDFVIANASLTILGMEDKMAWIRAINLMPISRFDDEI